MKILVFAPHNDDETLGVGGTIAKLSSQGHEVFICEVTSSDDLEVANMIKQEARDAHRILGVKESIFLDLPVVALKDTPTLRINKKVEDIVVDIRPNVAFIPHKGDMHIDHLEVARSAMVALRPIENPQLYAIYAYETLSETEWNIPSVDNVFIPNCWSDISEYLYLKINAMRCYKTQIRSFPHPRSIEAIEALAHLRGTSIGSNAAESFMLIRQRMQ